MNIKEMSIDKRNWLLQELEKIELLIQKRNKNFRNERLKQINMEPVNNENEVWGV